MVTACTFCNVPLGSADCSHVLDHGDGSVTISRKRLELLWDEHWRLAAMTDEDTPHAIAAAVLGISEDDLRRRLLWAERVQQLVDMTYPELGRLICGDEWNEHYVEDMRMADGADSAVTWIVTRLEDGE